MIVYALNDNQYAFPIIYNWLKVWNMLGLCNPHNSFFSFQQNNSLLGKCRYGMTSYPFITRDRMIFFTLPSGSRVVHTLCCRWGAIRTEPPHTRSPTSCSVAEGTISARPHHWPALVATNEPPNKLNGRHSLFHNIAQASVAVKPSLAPATTPLTGLYGGHTLTTFFTTL